MAEKMTRGQYSVRFVVSGVSCFMLVGWLITLRPVQPATFTHALPYQADLYARQTPAPDVVFLGSSRTAVALKPDVVDEVLSRAAGRPVRSFNFGLPAVGTGVTYRLAVDGLLQGDHLPVAVVMGIEPCDVAGLTEQQLNRDVTIGTEWRAWSRLHADLPDPLFQRNLLLSAIIPGRNRWEFLRHRWVSLRDARPLQVKEFVLHDNGWAEILDARDEKKSFWDVADDNRHTRLMRSYGLILPVCAAAQQAVVRLREAGVKVLVHEQPFPPSLQDAHHSGVYEAYRTWVDEVLVRSGAIPLPGFFGGATDDDYMADAHVAPWAADRYSVELAQLVAKVLTVERQLAQGSYSEMPGSVR